MDFGAGAFRCRIEFMLRETFLHIPGIGPKRERALYRAGISTWDEFLALRGGNVLPNRIASLAIDRIEESAFHLQKREAAFFDRSLPWGEKWRMWRDFADEAVFLDIETTGMAYPFDYVTVVGLHDALGTHAFVRGENLFMLPDAISRYSLVVTFNGAQFDLPFLKAHMGDMFARHGHIDLRFVLRKLGYRGGLKSIEKQLGLRRPDEVADIDGFEAVRLWQRHLRGDDKSLEKLVAYNRQDVENLRPLVELAYDRLRRATLGEKERAASSADTAPRP
jgi:uncharacterized protein YprB with RNaseH-like and TPR domain